MNKQTVYERYDAQQFMQQKMDRRTQKVPSPKDVKALEAIYQQIERGLVQTEQAIRQASSEEPSLYLALAQSRLTYVSGLVKQVQVEANRGNNRLRGSMTEQLKQLEQTVKHAAEVIQQMQTKLK